MQLLWKFQLINYSRSRVLRKMILFFPSIFCIFHPEVQNLISYLFLIREIILESLHTILKYFIKGKLFLN